jgi:hypothetical protein
MDQKNVLRSDMLRRPQRARWIRAGYFLGAIEQLFWEIYGYDDEVSEVAAEDLSGDEEFALCSILKDGIHQNKGGDEEKASAI